MKKALCILCSLALIVCVFAGCASSSGTADSAAPVDPGTDSSGEGNPQPGDAGQGGTLRIGVSQEVTKPLLSFALTGAPIDYYSSWPVYESLFRPNAEGSVDPWLLESYSADPDAMTYTFHVRQGITFSDGSVLNAEAVKWNLDHYLEVGSKVSALLPTVESVEIVDDYTVQINLSEWSSILPYVFSRECGYMFSKEFFEKNGEEYCEENPCGTGPFVLENWERDVKRTYVKRDDYWDGEVKLDRVEYIVYKDPLVATAALETGELDAYLGMDPENAEILEANDFVIGTCSVKSHSYLLCFNSLDESGNDPTGNLLVRQAIAYAIDDAALVQAVWGDYADVRNQFGVGQYFYSDSVTGYGYDPDKARDLLAAAGYADGCTIELKTEDNPSPKVKAVTIIQQYLAEVGITADISILSGADASNAEAGWGDGVWLHSSSVYVSVPMQMAGMFRQNLTGHVLGLSNLLRPDDVEEQLALSVTAPSEEDAVKAIGEANRLITDEHLIIYNFAEVPTIFVTNPKVKDSDIGEVFYSIASLGKAWIDE